MSSPGQPRFGEVWVRLAWTGFGMASAAFIAYPLVQLGTRQSREPGWDMLVGLVGVTGLVLTCAAMYSSPPLRAPIVTTWHQSLGELVSGGLRGLLGLVVMMFGLAMMATAIVPPYELFFRVGFIVVAVFLFFLAMWILPNR